MIHIQTLLVKNKRKNFLYLNSTMVNKRLYKELGILIQQQNSKVDIINNDYIIYYEDSDLTKIHAMIKGPYDSIYRHKFIRLLFEIPENYPHSPPIVTFVKNDDKRIHPILYENGRICLTILNTWPSDNERWSSSMGIETILLTILSFLDNNPYIHEPGGKDDSSYTTYVEYQSWDTCLLKYLLYSEYLPDLFLEYINSYLLSNINQIFYELNQLFYRTNLGYYYTKCFYIEYYIIDYNEIIHNLSYYISSLSKQNYLGTLLQEINNQETNNQEINNQEINNQETNNQETNNQEILCNICFDSNNFNERIILECRHSFHLICIKQHIDKNGEHCSMCRRVSNDVSGILIDKYVINPVTKRKIKVNGKIFKYLLDLNIF